MRVIIAGGGTAGHINPALAIAGEIKKRHPHAEILYIGSKKGMEAKLVPKAGYRYEGIDIMGFSRSIKPRSIRYNLKALMYMFRGNSEARRLVRDFRPDLAVGTGGYISGPVLLQACKYGCKTAIHEQNAFPGITTKALAKRVDMVLGAVQEVQGRLEIKGAFHVVGNPVREGFVFADRAQARKALGIDPHVPVILSSGGSLGAEVFNNAVAELMAWHAKEGKIYHIHSRGTRNGTRFDQRLSALGVAYKNNKMLDIRDYIDDMATCYAAADLLISRAGAMSLAELTSAGKASILIPSPNVTENHQYFNAKVLADKGAAILIEEKDLTGEKLIGAARGLIFNPARLQELSRKASAAAVVNSGELIYEHLSQLLKKEKTACR